MSKVLIVIDPQDFQDTEFAEPKEELEKAGHKITIASTHKGLCFGALGSKVESDIAIKDAKAKDYDAIIFIGGPGSAIYFDNKPALELIKQMNKDRKIIGSICIAPVTLALAGILKGKKATVFPTQSKAIESRGAKYLKEPVVVDGNIVTADGPSSARLFGKTLVKLLGK